MCELYIIRGLPGSGKSTQARDMLKRGVVQAHYEADMFFMTDGVYQFNANKIRYAHEWCFEAVRHALLTRNQSVAVSNTFTQKWEAAKYIAMAKLESIPVVIVTCTGEYGSVHDVPEESMQKMRARFVADTSDWI